MKHYEILTCFWPFL